MSKIVFLVFLVSLSIQLLFSFYYSQKTYYFNNRFQKLYQAINILKINNNQLLLQVASSSATIALPSTSSSSNLLPLHE